MDKWYSELPVNRILALLLWGECRGEVLPGIVGVANVVRNRVKHYRWAHNFMGVMLQPDQFDGLTIVGQMEPFEPGVRLDLVARLCIADLLRDNVGGATHFCAIDSHPYWRPLLKPRGRIGDHLFFEEE